MNHRDILLYGFHFSFMFIFTLAVIRDLYFVHFFNASVNFSALSMTFVSYYLLHFKQKSELASFIIMAVAVIPLYTLIYFNHFDNMVIVYVILLPLAVFFLVDFKRALIINFFMYVLLLSMLYYIAQVNPTAAILNNPFALINIAFASILIMFFGIFYHLAIDSSISALIYSNRQKDILLNEVHHRVKNNLNVIASILGLQAMGKEEILQEELLRTKSRIESIAIVHEMLYSQNDFEQIEFNAYVEKLYYLVLNMEGDSKKLQIDMQKSQSVKLPLNIMVQFGLIVNELLINTLKYATNAQELRITLEMHKENGCYRFTYCDNGEQEVEVAKIMESKTLGIKLIKLSVQQLAGSLQLTYNNGLCYAIDFCLDERS